MEVKRSEIYRYLGIRESGVDEGTEKLVESCLWELQEAVSPRFFFRTCPLTVRPDGKLDFFYFEVESHDLWKNMKGCDKAILFAATLGAGPDFLIRKYSRLEMSRAVVIQAASAAMIEAFCDEENDRLRKEAEREGYSLRPRFSPGYGDFPLQYQKKLLSVLEAGKTVGITLTDSLLMMPSKSVTALIGAGKTECRCEIKGCEVCGRMDCPYRRG